MKWNEIKTEANDNNNCTTHNKKDKYSNILINIKLNREKIRESKTIVERIEMP